MDALLQSDSEPPHVDNMEGGEAEQIRQSPPRSKLLCGSASLAIVAFCGYHRFLQMPPASKDAAQTVHELHPDLAVLKSGIIQEDWVTNIGPLQFNNGHVGVKPQMDFGVEGDTVDAHIGIDDITKKGFNVHATADVKQPCSSYGHSFEEMKDHITCGQSGVAKQFETSLAKAFVEQQTSNFKNTQTFLNDVLGTNFDLFKIMDSGKVSVTLKGYSYTGAALTTRAALGTTDEDGYSMVGMSVRLCLLVGEGFALRAGMKNPDEMKITVNFPNFVGNIYLSNLVRAMRGSSGHHHHSHGSSGHHHHSHGSWGCCHCKGGGKAYTASGSCSYCHSGVESLEKGVSKKICLR